MTRSRTKPATLGKREAILAAVLEVAVERGFHDAPMSLIAERSGASAGVIYHYFPSKEAIIQAVYDRICALKRAKLLDGYGPHLDARGAFLGVFARAYAFNRDHLREMHFLAQYESAGFRAATDADRSSDDERIAFERRFRGKAKGGVLDDLPEHVLYELTLGLAARLAKQPKRLTRATLQRVAERVWESIRAHD